MQKRWDNFCKKILRYELNFDHVVNTIIEFTSQPYNAMIREDEFFKVKIGSIFNQNTINKV